MSGELPYRSPAPGCPRDGRHPLRGDDQRPTVLPLPPAQMPGRRGLRPLKRWRYVGVFCEELMLCVGDVRVGPGRQTFWAVWDRRTRRLRERTRWWGHGHVALGEGRVTVRARGLTVDLELDETDGIETVCPHGRQYVWTRKQGGVPARGELTANGRTVALAARAIIDDTAGYHARQTAWRWSAGVGRAVDGRGVAWNLVEGVNDPPLSSERTLWLDGRAQEVGPVRFDEQLRWVRAEDGSELRFAAEAQRGRRDNLLLVSSDYRQPFGAFSGVLAGGVALGSGLGVMEDHRARW